MKICNQEELVMKSVIFHYFSLILVIMISISCSHGGGTTPVTAPLTDVPDITSQSFTDTKMLWGAYKISGNTETMEIDISPIRNLAAHYNLVKFLEQGPCTDCVALTSFENNGDGTFNVGVTITHPFDNMNFTGFDVSAIVMFNGSATEPITGLTYSDSALGDGELLNADFFTTEFNPETAVSGLGLLVLQAVSV